MLSNLRQQTFSLVEIKSMKTLLFFFLFQYDKVSGIVIIWVSQAYFSEFPQLV